MHTELSWKVNNGAIFHSLKKLSDVFQPLSINQYF